MSQPQKLDLNRWQLRVADFMERNNITVDPTIPPRYVAPLAPGDPAPPSRTAPTAETLAAATRDRLTASWQQIVPAQFHEAKLVDLGPVMSGQLQAWASSDPLPNLLFTGPVGTGKSHAAVAAARHLFGRNRNILWVSSTDLLHRLRYGDKDHDPNPGRQKWFDQVNTVDVLVVDDLGMERRNDWHRGLIEGIVDTRWNAVGRPIIATSNLEPDALAEALGDRAFSRFRGGGTVGFRLDGADRRMTA